MKNVVVKYISPFCKEVYVDGVEIGHLPVLQFHRVLALMGFDMVTKDKYNRIIDVVDIGLWENNVTDEVALEIIGAVRDRTTLDAYPTAIIQVWKEA